MAASPDSGQSHRKGLIVHIQIGGLPIESLRCGILEAEHALVDGHPVERVSVLIYSVSSASEPSGCSVRHSRPPHVWTSQISRAICQKGMRSLRVSSNASQARQVHCHTHHGPHGGVMTTKSGFIMDHRLHLIPVGRLGHVTIIIEDYVHGLISSPPLDLRGHDRQHGASRKDLEHHEFVPHLVPLLNLSMSRIPCRTPFFSF